MRWRHMVLILQIIICKVHTTASCGFCGLSSCARDCRDLYVIGFNTSGVYHINPADVYGGFDVYCDMETDDGGWLIFQRRVDGSVNFNRTWEDYQFGFDQGNLTGELWLGNYQLNMITSQNYYELRIDLEDWEGGTRYAKYRMFKVEYSNQSYTLVVEGYSGTAGNSLSHHNSYKFSTYDRDNGISKPLCADDVYEGGWWYHECLKANLNGFYYPSSNNTGKRKGIIWFDWKKHHYSLRKTEMKLRRV